MAELRQDNTAQTAALDYDVIIIGAGLSGMYQLYRLRELGLSARVFEAGTGVGGTWYWNRYPGARFDSESYSYGYSFSKELLEEWEWSEHFAGQPETLRYCNYVADKFDLRRDIQFESRVTSAIYQDDTRSWRITLESGARHACRFLITAIGPLSTPTLPRIEGRDDFRGQSFHTARWPKQKVDFTGKRVAVIGTGATGIQTIQTIAGEVGHLTVFQRTANWAAPLHNGKIDAETQARIKAGYPEIFARCKETFACFVHTPDPRGAFEVSEEEREAFYEKLYGERGFGIWQGNFKDILIDRAANATISDFVARKIRERVRDPKVAEMLIPKNHGFGTRRLPLETFYYEVYNRDNVELVDIKETPIERITPEGIRTTDKDYAFDIIIYATGFDAITGSFDKIDFRGAHGARLKQKWTHGPATYLGLMVDGFPNMMMLMGPHTALGNIPRSIEYSVDWVTGLIRFAQAKGLTFLDATPEGTADWTEHVKALGTGLLSNEVDSWMTGINRNVEGKQTRIVARYSGSAPAYRARCDEVAAKGYVELRLG
ncbi:MULTISPECIES: flavin-containing monooxygenase [Bradyrhizobium]|uniref:Cation diffusion facilitator CzcD-associated flavoprotein CzcO n=1 Tax=Bradyrhizobium elkanii TaxID=29448 RepID=A0A8I1YG85_BRAEL|nr:MULTISPECIES: NAD(P)/FAD-dependent oxidoreductase [Bradyrhizobium]MBP1299206.1 cation diffusion facilitator CzcD-associated flavoprotein CzcO [Bradyrhizobium elkanii]MCP1929935.1 cation diffusion facilitator CzcD-associated flavoprotein CzcO [Bradyrhizobium elkanii]MCS3481806.1 cation diffusion facilitator CzcD-associated flavoprotein CzcO [Bradyrhizobium elkanii]MCS3579450.1 cation diffusion facilitator CzcD-associated flavoprotein CzcO [Bradyrhizobium elkanii]MCS3722321.1 cation diffusion